jgi:hypothetical protein
MREISNEYNKILLLTDLTDKSLAAFSYARAFAEFTIHLWVSCMFSRHQDRVESQTTPLEKTVAGLRH